MKRFGTFSAHIVALTLSALPLAGLYGGEEGGERPPYIDRALNLPELDAHGDCPISIGDNNVVSSEHAYIFGAGGYFFGSGPVYLALSWKPGDRAEAWFELNPRMLTSNGYSLKTPWIMNPDYSGAALIRGVRIGSEDAQEIAFHENTQAEPVTEKMTLRSELVGTFVSSSQKQAVNEVWGFWPSSMILSGPGCYAIQIDTEGGSDIVVFEAKAQS